MLSSTYSNPHGMSRKKNAMMITSVMDQVWGLVECSIMSAICWITWIGMGLMQCFLPCIYHILDAEVHISCHVETWVSRPHTKERLRNVWYIIFSQFSPDGIYVDNKFSSTNLVYKDL